MYPVYSKGPIHGSRPLFFVNADERREYLLNGSAKSVNRGTAIQLLVNLEQFRGISAQMGPSVIMGNLLPGPVGHFYRSIVEAWA